MKADHILFDLDGTLTDSGEGIIKSAIFALAHFGIQVEDPASLRCFVGPPLRVSFPRFGIPEESVDEAIAVFRSRYLTIGKFENDPYPGIAALLEQLHAAGKQLYVATSKPEATACEILDRFGLSGWFRRICGASFDAGRENKEAVIRYLLEAEGLTRPEEQLVMVGDTAFDVCGAAVFGIPTIGVTWGYGSREAMEQAGAAALADSCEELLGMLLPKDAAER